MTNISVSLEQREFRAVMRAFAEAKVAPNAALVDRKAEFPWESFRACVEMELPGLGISSDYGGSGADSITQAIMVEELARVCASTSLTILISKLGMIPIIYWGSEELKRKYVTKVALGQAQASYCLSEPDAGSDVASMSTTAVLDGNEWVISGSKYWITNAGISDTYTVFAKTDLAAGHKGISAFLVEADHGVKVTKLEDKLGIKGSPTGEILFDDVRIPRENLIGDLNRGFYIAMGTLDRSRPMIGAQAVGIAQGAIDYAANYVRQRHQFGRSIASNQGIQFMVADMQTKTEAARALVYRACGCIDDDPDNELSKLGAMAKLFASDTAMSVTVDALQLLGGYGYSKDFPLERMMRDAKITQIYEGTNQIQRIVVAKSVLQ